MGGFDFGDVGVYNMGEVGKLAENEIYNEIAIFKPLYVSTLTLEHPPTDDKSYQLNCFRCGFTLLI